MTNTTHRGHGGRNSFDQGAVGNGTTEYKEVSWVNDRMLAVTKWKDTSDFSATNVNGNLVNITSNVNRVAKASDVNVSNHQNAFNRSATGVEVWYYLGDSKGRQLAERLSVAIAKELGLTNRGAKATTNLYVVSQTVGTTVLIEWCFVDNANDMNKWRANKHKAVDAALNVLGYKVGTSQQNNKPSAPAINNGPGKNNKPLNNGKIGDRVKVFDNLYADSYGSGRSTAKRGQTGTIKKVASKGGKKYLVENWGWAHPNDIQLDSSATTSKPTPKSQQPISKSINVGSRVKMHSKASHYQTRQRIPDGVKKGTYTVLEIEKLPKKQSDSNYRYLLKEITSWVLGQDIYGV